MQIGKEIPDLPASDYRFMVTIMIDGHGRPRQLEREIGQTLERMLWDEFGEMAELTLLMRTSTSERETPTQDPLQSDGGLVLTNHPDDPMVEN